jgi:hypothetical protein
MILGNDRCRIGYVPKCERVEGWVWYFDLTLGVGYTMFSPCAPFDLANVKEGSVPMAAQLLKQLLGRLCPHRFSWPHSGSNGQDYQVCLICGTIYAYDWSTMRRTGRLAASPDGRTEVVQRDQP